MKGCKLSLIEVWLGKDLDLRRVTLQVDKDKGGTSSSDSHDTTGQADSDLFNESIVLGDSGVVFATELINSVGSGKLVRVRIDTWVTDILDEISSVLGVLRRVLLFLIKCRAWILLFRLATSGLSLFGLSLGCSSFGSCFLGSLLLLLSLLLALFEFTNGAEIRRLINWSVRKIGSQGLTSLILVHQ